VASTTNGSDKAAPAAEKTAGLTKMEIVRRTISHLGRDAKLLQIQSDIKAKYGVEMTVKHISACKSEIQREVGGGAKLATPMAAAKLKAAPKPVAAPKPAAKKLMTQRSAAKTTAAPNAALSPPMTKAEALRQALSDLGTAALPMQLQAHIKDKFGIEISTSHISASKTNIVRKMVGGAKSIPAATTDVAPKPTTKRSTRTNPAPTEPQAKLAPTARSNGKAGGTIALADIQTVNTLVSRVGATNLKTLIDLLAE
jgi:hypothetical protein